jgi:uncharacterized protein
MSMTGSDAEEGLDAKLIAAVKANDAAAATELLALGANPDARAVNESALLFTAVGHKNPALVKLLAEKSRQVNLQDSCDFTPFTQAVRLGLPEIAHILLDHGAQPFPPGKGADYALDWAIANKLYDVAERILKEGGWPDRMFKGGPVLVLAAEQGDLKLAEACLKAGGSVARADPKNGYTALHVAAKKGDAEFIRFLLGRGAPEEAADTLGQTPLDWARNAGRDNILRGIISAREMQAAAKELTDGLKEGLAVRRPYRLKRGAGPA